MKTALLVDIGSTYTKTALVDLEQCSLLGRSQAATTVNTEVTVGLKNALFELEDWEKAEYKLACSSAAGGLKIVAIGLVPAMTAEAAKRAALGAGSRVVGCYSYSLTDIDIKEIISTSHDIILLAGGTDGGNKENIINNARKLADTKMEQPVVIAGNRNAADEAAYILQENAKEVYITENVMPELEKLNIRPARETIREIFLKKITEARGLGKVKEIIDGIVMPTPSAVLKAVGLLADGTKSQAGLGELLLIDIGGATTDVYSAASGRPAEDNVRLMGMEEPYIKRTVEGDMGVRYNAPTLFKSIEEDDFLNQLGSYFKDISKLKNDDNKNQYTGINKVISADNCRDIIRFFHKWIKFIADDELEQGVENVLARNAARMSLARHAGRINTIFTPAGKTAVQNGKDLSRVKYIIGTGGIIVHSKYPEYILEGALYKNMKEAETLAPMESEILIDRQYLLAACGLLSEKEPDVSLELMKKYLLENS